MYFIIYILYNIMYFNLYINILYVFIEIILWKKDVGNMLKNSYFNLFILKVLGFFKEWILLVFWLWRIKFRSVLVWIFFVGLFVFIRVIVLVKFFLLWFFSLLKIFCIYLLGFFIRFFFVDFVCSEEEYWKCSLFLLFLIYLVNKILFFLLLRK